MQSGACRGAGGLFVGLDLRMIKGILLQGSVFFLNLEMRSSIENYEFGRGITVLINFQGLNKQGWTLSL